jgi:hypothetical protein
MQSAQPGKRIGRELECKSAVVVGRRTQKQRLVTELLVAPMNRR